MNTLYQTMKDNRLDKPIEVHEWKLPLVPGRLYRLRSSLFVALELGVALVLPDDSIKPMIKAGIIKRDAVKPDKLN